MKSLETSSAFLTRKTQERMLSRLLASSTWLWQIQRRSLADRLTDRTEFFSRETRKIRFHKSLNTKQWLKFLGHLDRGNNNIQLDSWWSSIPTKLVDGCDKLTSYFIFASSIRSGRSLTFINANVGMRCSQKNTKKQTIVIKSSKLRNDILWKQDLMAGQPVGSKINDIQGKHIVRSEWWCT